MPRARLTFRMPAKLQTAQARPLPNDLRIKQHPTGPKLYNAKRLIPTSRGLPPPAVAKLLKHPQDSSWRELVSPDVAEFIDDMEAQGTKLSPREQARVLANPARYFSRPQNVPKSLRKQIYFPDFTVTMRRNDRLGPYYAQFNVPLDFSKLDLKAYLKELYNVDVVHIRSYVTHATVARKRGSNPWTRGPVFRLASKKRMTVQLVEPFVWPKKPRDVDQKEFSRKEYYDMLRAQSRESAKTNDYFGTYVDKEYRRKMAEQARDVLEGKLKWAPTWQQLPETRRMLTGRQLHLTAEEIESRTKQLSEHNAVDRIEQADQTTGLGLR